MIKYVEVENNPLDKLKAGVNIVADVVKTTLGPAGKNVLLPKGGGVPKSTRDGVTVAEAIIKLKDPIENYGAQSLKEAARVTNSNAGDGTTTATVLAQAIFNEGLKHVVAGNNPIEIKRQIDEAVEKAVNKLKDISTDVSDKINDVATISANNDSSIGLIIGEAVKKVGKDGTILVENSHTDKTHLTFQEGTIIERGWNETSMYFINTKRKTIEYDNPRFLIIDDKINSFEQIKNVIQLVAKDKFPLILSITEVADEVLFWLARNKIEAGLPIAVIKTPGWNNPDHIQDFAHRVGARCFNNSLYPISKFEYKDLGSAERVIIRAIDTTIIQGCGNIDSRLVELDAQIKEAQTEDERKRIQDRINRLRNSVATIHVAADSEQEMIDKKLRIEDAIHATRAAVDEGIVPGGGTAFLKIKTQGDDIGSKIINRSLEAPFRTIVKNAGENDEKIIAQIKDEVGYNAKTKELCNLLENGIIDPVKVSRTAIQKAASVAGMLLTTGSVIYFEEINEQK